MRWGIGLVGLAWLAGIGLLVAVGWFEKPGQPAQGALSQPSIAATAEALAVTDAPDPNGGGERVVEAFDELPMDSRPKAPWVVMGADSAEVVALPTSVDRSLRLGSSTAGDPTIACRPAVVGGPVQQVALDLRVGRPPPTPVTVVQLVAGDTVALDIRLDSSGALASFDASGDPTSSAGTTGAGSNDASWQRLAIALDAASGSITWQAHDANGGTATGAIARSAAAGAVDMLCLRSPEGVPSAWIAIDDLVISG